MSDPVVDSILNQYFRRLELALARVQSERRKQIIEEICEHVSEALAALPEQSEVAVLEMLDRVGSPKEIAREAMVDDGHARRGCRV